jgi:3-methyladenine DNA glycosylase/8-oxoguanine DNA glycosylase
MVQIRETSVLKRALQLAEHAQSLPEETFKEDQQTTYEHMGATITEAVLQAGLGYEAVVRPRVARLQATYPEATTTTGFLEVLQDLHLAHFLKFSGYKPKVIRSLTERLAGAGVETERDFAEWIQSDDNHASLKGIHGVGDKTIDYLKALCGLSTAAIDVHLLRFLREASIQVTGYNDAQRVVHLTADLLKIDRGTFDRSIWKYMTARAR